MSTKQEIERLKALRLTLAAQGNTTEIAALDTAIKALEGGSGSEQAPQPPKAPRGRKKTYLKLKKKYYTPAEVARKVGVSRQTIVKWIERGELEAEVTAGGHHRIPASVFHHEGRGEPVQLIPADEQQ